LSTETNKESIVLDSFSGSGTTWHSVLELNNEDGGNRKFILVEMEDYADRITAERIRRVIKGAKKSADEDLKNGLRGTFSYFELGDAIEHESILHGKKMPSYKELARYVFYTATGEEFDDRKIKKDVNFIGSSKEYDIYMYYEPDVEKLKRIAFTLDMALNLPKSKKKRLVFAPTKYIDNDSLQELKIDFCQLPFEIYRMKK
jgi:adenine-specific DNA-methyltransferase